ncbi:MAG: site-specific DNA-methyltransferase [Ignavibacteriaceae bacterium]|nr:site-specific DNA-methyltransferase [Ignavibacteriaceae bacterium]
MLINKDLHTYLSEFILNDLNVFSKRKKTVVEYFEVEGIRIPKFINEFWTSKQRQGNPIHQVSYRACFKAELPRFFIKLLTKENDVVYDPFAGRGTTIIEAALINRNVIANDINPLSTILSKPRLSIPSFVDVKDRLKKIKFKGGLKADIDLSMFYHLDTESEIVSLRNYLVRKMKNGKEDFIDEWIRMVATNRLTGHSKNFFSVYTLPPNQAVTPERQKKINKQKDQKPVYKDVKFIILKKTRDLISEMDKKLIYQLKKIGSKAKFLNNDARLTSSIRSNSINLTVTSPPFLDIVNYTEDNWLRCWFNNIGANDVARNITITKKLDDWETVMFEVFKELYRITKRNGYIAFEVGEVRRGKVKLDEHIVPLGMEGGFECLGIVINLQNFTKTANIWGINNNKVGTNTNRIVVFRKI